MIKDYESVSDFLTKTLEVNCELTQDSLASVLGMSRTSFGRLINGEADLSLKNALLLERYTGVGAQEWVNLDLEKAIKKVREKEQIFEKDTVKQIHVFIDSENIHPNHIKQLSRLGNFKLWFMYNIHERFNFADLHEYLTFKDSLELVPVKRRAKNALDFHITYLVGRLLALEPNSQCYILSNDKGYDPLCEHITENGAICKRITSFQQLPVTNMLYKQRAKMVALRLKERSVRAAERAKAVKAAKKDEIKKKKESPKQFIAEDIRKVCSNLAARFHHKNVPVTRLLLVSSINSIKGLMNSVDDIVNEMSTLGLITLNGGERVNYNKRQITYYSLYGHLSAVSLDDSSQDVMDSKNEIVVKSPPHSEVKASGRKDPAFYSVLGARPSSSQHISKK